MLNKTAIIVESSIVELVKEFNASPSVFISEADFQYRLYSILKVNEELNKSVVTLDGKMLNLIYPEYPSVHRVKLPTGKGYRVWFDLAILNTEFIRQNTYATVKARNENDAKVWGKNVLVAIEMKFFPKKMVNMARIVEQDCFKLSKCNEVEEKYVLVFSKFVLNQPIIEKIEKYGVKLIWVGLPQVKHDTS
jgi:hypothetical protein